ncbi:PGF-pre-PGF domain-containing protein [Halobellus marinus]|uniref:PGF-pre-PGF domain-containing protein n=1 Tax=Halobellus TaxID=1073986 RepID=UPI0028A991F7|nr:PGF-pre-PGF domain-containing protein [Halobellus sp. DFY28]
MRSKTWLIALLVIVVALGGASAATAQEEAPGDPASFYGAIEDADGNPAPEGTTIYAVVDGETEATITVETAGEYGGSGATDDKLRIDSNAGDQVSFHVNSADGPQSQSTYALEAGVHEQDLTFPAGTFAADEDDGDDGDDDAGGGGGGGDGAADEPAPEPQTDVEGDAVAESSFDGQTLSTQVESASAGSSVTARLDDNTVNENLQNTGASLNSLNTRFARDVSNVNVDASYSQTNPSEEVPDLSAETNADEVAYVNVDTNVAEDDLESVTFEFSVSRDRLSESDLSPDEVALYRFNDGEYEEYDASVESEGDDRVTYTAEVPGLSVFAIGEETDQVTATTTAAPDTDTPDPDTATPEPDTPTDTPEPDGDGPGALLIGGIVIVVLAIAAGAYLAFGRE